MRGGQEVDEELAVLRLQALRPAPNCGTSVAFFLTLLCVACHELHNATKSTIFLDAGRALFLIAAGLYLLSIAQIPRLNAAIEKRFFGLGRGGDGVVP